MWAYDFMQNALIAGLIVGTICGIVSVFVILRRTAFAAHALSHISLTGAAGSVLVGLSAITGQLLANTLAAIIMGLLSDKIRKNDLAIGVVLTFFLGLGAYFLFLFQNNYSGGVMSILFGNILSVSREQIILLLILGIIILGVFLIIARPLLLLSIDPAIAEAKNVATRLLSVIFFIVLALTISMACQIVGTLLIFALLIIPGAIASQWCDGFYKLIFVSVLTANLVVIVSLYLAYNYNLPISFCITMLMSLCYAIGYAKGFFKKFNLHKV